MVSFQSLKYLLQCFAAAAAFNVAVIGRGKVGPGGAGGVQECSMYVAGESAILMAAVWLGWAGSKEQRRE